MNIPSAAARSAASPTWPSQLERIALDLLARLPSIAPRRVANLFGGWDGAEQSLKKRFPDAEIQSIHYNELPSGRAAGEPLEEPFDLIFSSGVLENRPPLRQLAPKLLSLTQSGSWFAFQFPNNLHEPNRQIQRMLAVDGPWSEKLLPIAKTRPFNETIEDLDATLALFCSSIEIWETTYVYRLDSVGAIIDAMREANLAAFLAPLDDGMRGQFLARLQGELARAYPKQPDGKVLWRFPRIFFMAQR
jgi:trans-aconitate 2-methyltransferase